MKFAILTDIHANREAFQAVLDDARAREAERIVILGDIVGYGPDPEWCCDTAARMMAEGAICVKGNHDSAAAGAPESMSTLAGLAIDWTKTRLSGAQRRFLAGLPMVATFDDMLFVHASADNPWAWSYVTSNTRAAPSFRAATARLIFCGHTHVPLLVTTDKRGVGAVDTGTNTLSFRRTAYDVQKTADKVRAAGLPEDLALRLLRGS